LCPRERRVFQSKLGVSSSNQCNLHHSPHTGHLEKIKNKKKGKIFFGHGVYHEMRLKALLKSRLFIIQSVSTESSAQFKYCSIYNFLFEVYLMTLPAEQPIEA
jgi:hypothetical protein